MGFLRRLVGFWGVFGGSGNDGSGWRGLVCDLVTLGVQKIDHKIRYFFGGLVGTGSCWHVLRVDEGGLVFDRTV